MIEKSPFSKVDHIGVVVRDMDKAVEYYQSLGIGPFFDPLQNWVFTERKVMGKLIDLNSLKPEESTLHMHAHMGPVDLQLLQPRGGESLWKEFLETKGEGINHICFAVDNIDKEEAKLVEKGLTVLFSVRFRNGAGVALFDTGKVGGVLFELIQWPPE